MFSKPDLVASAKEQAASRPDMADVRSSGVGATAPGGHPSMTRGLLIVAHVSSTAENTLGEPGGAAVAGDPRLAEGLGDAWARRLTSDAPGRQGRQMPPYSRAEDNVRQLADAGVTLLAGTDAPNPGDRVRSKPAPRARTPCPVRYQPGAGPGRCHG
jgi:hypothetical protein